MKATGTVLPKLADSERAIAVPVDEAHGLVGQVQSGDHVDVLASYTTSSSATGQGQGVVKTLLQDKLVLRAGAQPTDGGDEGKAADKSIILRVSDREAVTLAHAADNGKVWVLLRPAAGAKESAPQTASIDSVLRGARTARRRSREKNLPRKADAMKTIDTLVASSPGSTGRRSRRRSLRSMASAWSASPSPVTTGRSPASRPPTSSSWSRARSHR